MSRIAFAALLALLLTACELGSSSMKAAKNGPITFEEGLPGNGQIEIVKPDGSGLRDLAPSAADQESPAWSSDGKRIAYLSNTSGSDSGDVFVMKIEERPTASNQGPACLFADLAAAALKRGPRHAQHCLTERERTLNDLEPWLKTRAI